MTKITKETQAGKGIDKALKSLAVNMFRQQNNADNERVGLETEMLLYVKSKGADTIEKVNEVLEPLEALIKSELGLKLLTAKKIDFKLDKKGEFPVLPKTYSNVKSSIRGVFKAGKNLDKITGAVELREVAKEAKAKAQQAKADAEEAALDSWKAASPKLAKMLQLCESITNAINAELLLESAVTTDEAHAFDVAAQAMFAHSSAVRTELNRQAQAAKQAKKAAKAAKAAETAEDVSMPEIVPDDLDTAIAQQAATL